MVSTITMTNTAGETGKFQYAYDDNGNISAVTTTTGGVTKTTQYVYDTAGQLVRENNARDNTTTLWTYDNAGNILTEKVYVYTTGTPSELLETNDYVYTSTQWGDLLTAYNGNMIYYDGMTTLGSFKVGNPTTYYNGTHWTFTWEHGRQLATMSDGTTTWTNTYNSDGLRTKRTDGTTTYTYYYEEGRLSAIKRNDLNMWIFYDEHGPVTIRYGVGTFHYVTNLQGDVVAIVGANGQHLVEYTYDAWGKVTSITGDYAYNLGIHNPILYRGYIYDHETQLYYCQSRYYDPEIGRFINADAFAATGQGFVGNNMFAYCCNNPVNYQDVTGYFALPAPTLIDYYWMHKSVQYDIAENYGYAIEVYVIGSKGTGRLDIYDASQNEYYEVKHRPAAAGWSFENQMEKYDASHVADWRFLGYQIDGDLSRGDVSISGWTEYKYWDIHYRLADDGVIIYTWILNEQRYNRHLAGVATVAAGAFICYASGGFSGLRIGIDHCAFELK